MRSVHSRHRHPTHSFALHYPHSRTDVIWGAIVAPALMLLLLFLLLEFGSARAAHTYISFNTISASQLGLAAAFTMARLLIAYALALVCAVPLAILATHSSLAQKILLPLFDILESVPFLAFFPVVVGLFLSLGFTDGAAIFILFLSMLWNIVFALVGGVGLIPRDIMYAAEVFGVKGVGYIRRILLPALVPQMVIGSVLALAQGWNIIIVAEVIRTYLPAGSTAPNLFGLGSVMVAAASGGNNGLFIAALGASVLIIALINLLVWQPLLTYGQRFKFE